MLSRRMVTPGSEAWRSGSSLTYTLEELCLMEACCTDNCLCWEEQHDDDDFFKCRDPPLKVKTNVLSRHTCAGCLSNTSLHWPEWDTKTRKADVAPLGAELHSNALILWQPAVNNLHPADRLYPPPLSTAAKLGECHSAHITPTKMNAAAATSQGLQTSDSANLSARTRPAVRWHRAYRSKYCSRSRSSDLLVYVDLRATGQFLLKMMQIRIICRTVSTRPAGMVPAARLEGFFLPARL